MVQQLTREQRIAKAALATAYTFAGSRKGIQCRLCNGMVYTEKRGASSEYDALANHIAKNHPEIQDELEEQFYRLNLG